MVMACGPRNWPAPDDRPVLVLTLIFGGIFLGVKAYEWNEVRAAPRAGPSFHLDGVPQRSCPVIFSLYFAMTGLHAAHMVIGVGLLSW